jgi:hypothetical protein
MFGLLPTFLGGTGGAPPTAPRKQRMINMSRGGMRAQTLGPVTYTAGSVDAGPDPLTVVRLTALSGVVESGSSADWIYTGQGGDFSQAGRASVSMPNGVDCQIMYTLASPTLALGNPFLAGLDSSGSNTIIYGAQHYGIYIADVSGLMDTLELLVFTPLSTIAATGDKIKFRRISGVITVYLFHAGIWRFVKTWTDNSQLYFGFMFGENSVVRTILQDNMT